MFATLRADGIECGMCYCLHSNWTNAWACCSGAMLYDDAGRFIIVGAMEFPDDSPCFSSRYTSFMGVRLKQNTAG